MIGVRRSGDGMLNVALKLVNDNPDSAATVGDADLAGIRHQLNTEPELRGRVRLVRKTPADEQMGAGIGLLTIAISSSGAVTALVRSLPALLKAQRAAATVELSLPDGRSVKITADSADDAQSLLDTALRNQQQP
ncbi:hypothetical protein P2Q00_42335 [Streptomyces coacervatus]|nr:hypothetical protein [Streptomyces coacervatus]MDF2272005.1 hypothetical protein [Streptomyces coacervatus]